MQKKFIRTLLKITTRILPLFLLFTLALACRKELPEYQIVAGNFVKTYYLEINPKGALQFTRGLASDKMNQELKLLAAREGKTVREILTEQALEYVKIHKEGNPQHLLTQYQENEDFLGFPAMSINTEAKKNYLKKMPKDMIQEMAYHLQEWEGFLKQL